MEAGKEKKRASHSADGVSSGEKSHLFFTKSAADDDDDVGRVKGGRVYHLNVGAMHHNLQRSARGKVRKQALKIMHSTAEFSWQ